MGKRLRKLRAPQTYAFVLADVVDLLESARQTSARAVNVFMTATYWRIGKRIVEGEQSGSARAQYGEELLEQLSSDLTDRFGRGFSRRNLSNMRQFYLPRPIWQMTSAKSLPDPQAPIWQTTSAKYQHMPIFKLPWSHYVRLLSVQDEQARSFYENEALGGGWTLQQLDRQINSLFYQRLALSQDKAALLSRERRGKSGKDAEVEACFKEPFVLEFLGLKDEYSESDLEDALITHLQSFLLELGDDFAFIGRQRRLRIGTRWYRIDLLFFHRRLRSLIIIDLKLGAFTREDAGQMHLYLNFAREHWMRPEENQPVGLILCSQRDDAVARYTLDGLPNKILAAEYRMKLPQERLLAAEIEKTRGILEAHAIARSAPAKKLKGKRP